MNVNVKLSLDDDSRRALASAIAGKPVRRLATRREVNAWVHDMLAGTIATSTLIDTPKAGRQCADEWCGDECCLQNQLLQSRVNVLQHRLDTRRS